MTRAVLRRPGRNHLEGWRDALQRGWSPSSSMPEQRLRDLDLLTADPDAFLARQWDPDAAGPDVVLPDGSHVKRLPSITFVIWDGGFAGVLGLRYQPDSPDLPETCLGHIGYGTVPWRQGQGLATRAVAELRAWLPGVGLPYADAYILPDNVASQRVMAKSGATQSGTHGPVAAYGDAVYQIWRLDAAAP